ncbi:flavodoxin family protein [Thermohalobacter berrensis]|uniref:NADPH-dependent FMN reductase n=1 Tax=Thermohalobacter berrensis TaxID=99594 RepID=A0A419SY37_9FIRM|nr:flavodoxin family protein [Thermohalobacter berrensis]RKD30106.1 NADPH-dependent FMN reductase [Thermohalobacter berrensis]
MRVVGFVGSPRKNGNTSTIVDKVLEGAKKKGAETKLYYLNDMNIKGCQGCLYCRKNEKCCVQDDMVKIYDDVKEANALVIGSPVYIHQVSAQTKLLLDRFYPLTDNEHKPRFGEKKLIMVYTQAAPLKIFFKKYFRYLEKSLEPMGLKKVSRIVATKCFEKNSTSNNIKITEKAFKIGANLV